MICVWRHSHTCAPGRQQRYLSTSSDFFLQPLAVTVTYQIFWSSCSQPNLPITTFLPIVVSVWCGRTSWATASSWCWQEKMSCQLASHQESIAFIYGRLNMSMKDTILISSMRKELWNLQYSYRFNSLGVHNMRDFDFPNFKQLIFLNKLKHSSNVRSHLETSKSKLNIYLSTLMRWLTWCTRTRFRLRWPCKFSNIHIFIFIVRFQNRNHQYEHLNDKA